MAAAVRPFTPELAEARCGVPAEVIRELARDLSETKRAVIYGRMGVSVQRFGSLCQWAIQVINILIGAFDGVGGARQGEDAQLDAAIDYLKKQLKESDGKWDVPGPPAFPDKAKPKMSGGLLK